MNNYWITAVFETYKFSSCLNTHAAVLLDSATIPDPRWWPSHTWGWWSSPRCCSTFGSHARASCLAFQCRGDLAGSRCKFQQSSLWRWTEKGKNNSIYDTSNTSKSSFDFIFVATFNCGNKYFIYYIIFYTNIKTKLPTIIKWLTQLLDSNIAKTLQPVTFNK